LIEEFEIRELSDKDLGSVADIHCLGFKDSALTKLGKGAVRRYYHWQLYGPHDVFAIGAFRGNSLVGFCFSGLFRGALSGFIKKNRMYLTGQVILRPWVLFDNNVRNQLSIGVKIGKSKARPPKKDNVSKKISFGILALVVHPGMQNKGVGWMLMTAVEQEARLRNYPEMHLTVSVHNHKAIRFYENMGWNKSMPNPGNWRGRMEKLLSTE
jgi:ribosomal protein S18 acetylase RimI-like enzyme